MYCVKNVNVLQCNLFDIYFCVKVVVLELFQKHALTYTTEFVPLNVDKDYEILTIPPHIIRRKDNHREIKPNLYTMDRSEQVIVLNEKLYLYCEIANKQFYGNIYD